MKPFGSSFTAILWAIQTAGLTALNFKIKVFLRQILPCTDKVTLFSSISPLRQLHFDVGYMASTATGCLAEERSADVIIQIAKPVLQQKKLYLVTKRVFDIVCSFLGLLILAIPMMIIALIITIDSPGAPIFRQERLGLNGKPFMIYKFRTMRLDAEANGPRWADEQDPRCTHFGRILRRTRLDELPQLYNILCGDMTFVGPRPERAYFYRKFEQYIPGFSNRLLVTPGLTGYAQVNGGYSLKPEEKIIYDMEYIKRQSVLLDMQCLLKTVHTVFSREGAR